MRRLLKFNLLSLLVSVSAAHATMLINPPPPYPQSVIGDVGFTLTYAANSTPGNPVVNTQQGYRFLNTSDPTNPSSLIYIDVTSNQQFQSAKGQPIVVTLSAGTTDNSNAEIQLTGAGIVNGDQDAPPLCTVYNTCQGSRGGTSGQVSNLSGYYSNYQRVRLSFSLTALCAANGAQGGQLCTGIQNMTGNATTLSQTIYVTIGEANANTGIGPVSTGTQTGSTIEQVSFNLQVTNVPPTLNFCPNTNEAAYYFPGDGQIYLTPGNFGPNASTGGATLQSLVFLAKPTDSGTVDPIPGGLSSNPIVSYPGISGQPTVTGFDNNKTYRSLVYAQNQVGIIGGSGCAPNGFVLQSRAIRGVLAESKCFIATAAYHDGRAAPVMMLRRFRDQILSQFEFGRKFIDTYYTYSPALAEWAWDKPIIRSIALRALTPIEFFAWAWLKFSHAQENPPAAVSSQPYIDRLKKQLDDEDKINGKSPESSEGYTEQEKKKLPNHAFPNDQSYTEKLKKTIPTEESSEGYSEKEKAALPPESEQESPIQAVQAGRDRKLGRADVKPIKNAVGFKLGISPGMDVIANGGVHTYDEVYDSSWKPDFYLHFEHQFIHSENFGSLAASIDLGINYASKYGLFDTDFPTGSGNRTSITKFTFLQIPLIVSGIYRFNLARIIRPYVGAGVGSIFYDEIRDDNVKSKAGYSLVYTTSLGISLLLDFFDSMSARDSYLSTGIQHTYLNVEYMYLNSFSTDVVFKRGGIYAGFLFEI